MSYWSPRYLKFSGARSAASELVDSKPIKGNTPFGSVKVIMQNSLPLFRSFTVFHLSYRNLPLHYRHPHQFNQRTVGRCYSVDFPGIGGENRFQCIPCFYFATSSSRIGSVIYRIWKARFGEYHAICLDAACNPCTETSAPAQDILQILR